MLPGLRNLFKSKKRPELNGNFLVASIDPENLSLVYFTQEGGKATPIRSTNESRTSDLYSLWSKALESLRENPEEELPQKLIVGLSEEKIETTTTIARLNREKSDQEIKADEIERILTEVGEQSKPPQKKLFFSSVTSSVLDGVRVGNPLGARGEVLELGCFNAYLEDERLSSLDKLAQDSNLSLEKVIPSEYSVARSFLDSGTKDGILIKVGMDYTSLTFVEDSNIVDVKLFALGLSREDFWIDSLAIALEEFSDHPRWPSLISFYDSPLTQSLFPQVLEKLSAKHQLLKNLHVEELNTRLASLQVVINSLSVEGLDI